MKETFKKVKEHSQDDPIVQFCGNSCHLVGEEKVIAIGIGTGEEYSPVMIQYDVSTRTITTL